MKYNIFSSNAFIVVIAVLMIACDDDFSAVGGEIIDVAPNNGFVTEEIAVIAYNEKVDNVQVSGLPGALVGVNNDAVFGNRVHSVLSQARLSADAPSFGTNPKISSVVVNIPYYSAVESTSTNENEEVETTYTLDSIYNANAIKLSLYYSDYFLSAFDADNPIKGKKHFSRDEFPVALIEQHPIYVEEDDSFLPDSDAVVLPNTAVCVSDDEEAENSAPAFHKVVTDSLVLDFFTKRILDKEGDLVLSNTNNFQDFFRGFYLKAAPRNEGDEGVLMYLNLSQASVNIYYTVDPETPDSEDSDPCLERPIRSFSIPFSGTQVNIVEGDFNQDIRAEIAAQDSIVGARSLYLKGGEGAIAVLEIFPGDQADRLAELAAEKIVLNDATIKLYVDATKTGLPSDWQRLYIYDYESGAPLIDLLLDPLLLNSDAATAFSASLGLLESDDTGHFYRLNVTQHVNNLIYNSDENTNRKLGLCVTQSAGLPLSQDAGGNVGINTGTILDFKNSNGEDRVLPAGAVIDPDGLVLYGNTATDLAKRLKLNLVYTKPID